MNKAAFKKQEIYNKIMEFNEQDLNIIENFIDYMRFKKNIEEKKIIQLEGILKGYSIDFKDLKKMRKETWIHVEQESADE